MCETSGTTGGSTDLTKIYFEYVFLIMGMMLIGFTSSVHAFHSYCVFLLNNVLGAANAYIKEAILPFKGFQATGG